MCVANISVRYAGGSIRVWDITATDAAAAEVSK